jgi:hypothetical protein
MVSIIVILFVAAHLLKMYWKVFGKRKKAVASGNLLITDVYKL